MLDDFGGLVLPANSRAQRDIPAASKGHCSAHVVLGRGEGVHTQAESWLELCNLYLLNAMLDVVELREQEIFHYGWDRNDPEVHIFDVVATLANNEKIAYVQDSRPGHPVYASSSPKYFSPSPTPKFSSAAKSASTPSGR